MKKPRQNQNTWLQHALRRSGWRPQRQVIAVGTLGVFIALIMGALYLSQVALEASRGREMRDRIEQRDELERRNEELRVEIAQLRSLPRLQAKARELGFTEAKATDIDYITVGGYVRSQQGTINTAQREVLVAQQPEYNETFGGWVEEMWHAFRTQFEGFNSQVR